MADTEISWTDSVWNPTTGCDKVSAGCDNCYALTMAKRLKGMGSAKYQTDGDPRTSGPGFGLAMHADALTIPLRWRKPRKVFVNSMSDLFHPKVTDEFIARVFAVMAMAPLHTFQILTKRAPRMSSLLSSDGFWRSVGDWGKGIALDRVGGSYPSSGPMALTADSSAWGHWQAASPLPNVWLGVSVEDQEQANARIPRLYQTPAAVRFLSLEPLLGPVDIDPYLWLTGATSAGPFYDYAGNRRGGGGVGGMSFTSIPAGDLHWVITGGESGAGARPADPDWFRLIRDQCAAAQVAYYHKQHGGRTPKANGREMDGVTHDGYPLAVSHA